MGLSNELISQFAKITNDNKKVPTESTIYGTTVMLDGRTYVRLDGSDRLTPVETTTVVGEDERVIVTIKNHTATITGNISSPAAQDKTVKELGNKIDEFDTVIADKVKAETAEIETAIITKLDGKYATFDGLDAKYASIDSLEAAEGEIGELKADNVDIKEKLTARDAEINQLKANSLTVEVADAKYATIENLEGLNADFNSLESTYADFVEVTTNSFEALEAEIAELDVEKLDARYATIAVLQSDYITADEISATYITASAVAANYAKISTLEADYIKTKDLEANYITADAIKSKYAEIDLANVTTASIGTLLANVGLITSATIVDGHVTGYLDSVGVNANNITAGTLTVDRLIISGTDKSIIYAINNAGELVSAETDTINGDVITKRTIAADHIIAGAITANEIHSSAITSDKIATNAVTADKISANAITAGKIAAKAVTADKISVTDLNAIVAKIGNFNIGSNSIYSGAKSGINNTTRGIYMDTDGQMNLGDSNNYLKFYKDQNGTYKLAIAAESLTFGASGTSVEDAINDVQDSVKNISVGGRNLVLGTSTPFERPTTTNFVSYSGAKQYQLSSIMTSDPKKFWLSFEDDEYLTLSYDIYFPRCYKNTALTLNRVGAYWQVNYKNNTTGTNNVWYGSHSTQSGSTNKHNLDYVNSLVSFTATERGYIGHYSVNVNVKKALSGLYADPDNFTVTMSANLIVDQYGYTTGGYIKNIKLERGNCQTEWTPAPEDVDTGISNAQTSANNAQSTANAANTTANNAQTSANNAQSTANTANTTANNALNTANAAQPKVSHSVNGGGNSNMYINFATLKITQAYVNYPINFRVVSRGYEASDVQIMFNSVNGTDPTLNYIRANGTVPLYIVKTATSTWNVIMKKNESYGNCVITQFYNPTSITVTWTSTQIASLPSGYVQASGLAESREATNYLKYDATNGLVIGNMTASTLGNNVRIDSDSVDIRNGDTVLASYGANTIYLGKNKDAAIIDICNGFAQLEKYALDAGGEWHGLSIRSTNSVGLAATNEITMDTNAESKNTLNMFSGNFRMYTSNPWSDNSSEPTVSSMLINVSQSKKASATSSPINGNSTITATSTGYLQIASHDGNNGSTVGITLEAYGGIETDGTTPTVGTIAIRGRTNIFGILKTNNSATIGTSLKVGTNATVGGTLGVTGATTLTSLTTSGAITAKSTLAVTGNTTLSTLTTSGAITAKSTLAVTGATTLTGDLTAKSTASISGNTTLGGILYMPNNKPIYMKNASGAYRQVVYVQGDNLYRFGYGSYSNSEGRTDLMGNEIRFYVKYANETNYKPYIDGGDSVSLRWFGGGFISSSGKSVYFSIPLTKPVIGGCTVSVTSVGGLTVRQNNAYVYGSASSTYAKPSSYSAVVDAHSTFIRITATMSNTTNAINNAPCGIDADIKLTFAYG